MSFVKVSKAQFTKWADAEFLIGGWSYKKPIRGKELVIVIPDKDLPALEYHIYTTLTDETKVSRDLGKDAIRITLYDVKSAKPVTGTKRVNRTEGATTIWERMQDRLEEVKEVASRLNFCRKCGAHQVKRTKRSDGSTFLACTGWPACPDTSAAKSKYPFKHNVVATQNKVTPYAQAKKDIDAMLSESNKTGEVIVTSTQCQGTELVAEEDNIATSEYPYAVFPFPKFNRVQSTIMKEEFWKKDINLVLGTTTSSGKTVAAELFMANTLQAGEKVVYVSPLKSLTQEKYEEWGERYSQYNIMILTGDYVLTDARAKELNKADLICLTSEMIDSRTRNHQSEKSEWMFGVRLVIVDESHIISTNRGHAVEVGLMRFAKLVPKAKILCLSATMPNVEDFKVWLTKLNGKNTEVINSDWRPTKLSWHFLPHVTYGSYFDIQADKRSKALELVMAKPKEKFLVFVHDKNTGRMLERTFKSSEIETAFHNADLSLTDRLSIERSFADKEKGLRVIISTSTLAWGRSLPARNVVIVGAHRGINEVDELDIIQMAGRAGRLGIDPCGDCFLICDDVYRWQHTVKNPRKVESTLLSKSILGFHLLAEIKNNTIFNWDTMQTWFERTLATLQLSVDDDLLKKTFLQLEKWGMLFNDDSADDGTDVYKITRLGRVSATLYYFPEDIFHWSKMFGIMHEEDLWTSDLALAYVLGTTPSLSLGYVPKAEIIRVEEFTSHVAGIWPGERWRLKQSIMATDLYDLLSQGEKSYMVKNIQNDIDRIAQALTWIDGIKKWKPEGYWNALPMRIRYGIGYELVELCALPGIGAVRAKKLYAEGLSTIKDVKQHPEIVNKLMGKTLANAVLKSANALVRQANVSS